MVAQWGRCCHCLIVDAIANGPRSWMFCDAWWQFFIDWSRNISEACKSFHRNADLRRRKFKWQCKSWWISMGTHAWHGPRLRFRSIKQRPSLEFFPSGSTSDATFPFRSSSPLLLSMQVQGRVLPAWLKWKCFWNLNQSELWCNRFWGKWLLSKMFI